MRWNKAIALLLTLVMCFSLLPLEAMAEEEPPAETVQIAESPAEEPAPETEAPAPEEPAPEPELPAEEPAPEAETPVPEDPAPGAEEPAPAEPTPVETEEPPAEETPSPAESEDVAPPEAEPAPEGEASVPESSAAPEEEMALDGEASPEEAEEAPVPEEEPEPETELYTYVNPLYAGVLDEGDLLPPSDLQVDGASVKKYTSLATAGAYMRGRLKARASTITFKYKVNWDTATTQVLVDLFDKAVEHTGEPTEGDYILWCVGGWRAAVKYVNGNTMQVTYTVTYYTTASQEKAVTRAVNAAMAGMSLGGKNEYDKVRAIYDYICDNVVYDYEHVSDSGYLLQFTAYAAIVRGVAVCQGYAVLLYRMMLTAGIDCRVVTGDGGGPHAWNLVRLGEYYYYVDSTWDAECRPYEFFLKKSLPGHVPEPPYSTAAFKKAYPVSATDYQAGYLTSLTLTTRGLRLTWNAVPGATDYQILRKAEGEGNWTPLVRTADNAYEDRSAVSGVTYTYAVRCVDGAGNYTSESVNSLTRLYVAAPRLKAVTNTAKGVKITWAKVPGAAKYRVYRRKAGSSKWVKVGDTTAASLVDAKAKRGTKYAYTVRCVSADGKSATSAYDETGKTILRLATPKLVRARSTAKGRVTVTWKKVTGAKGYSVYRRTARGQWKRIAKVKGGTRVTYVDKSAKSGVTYYYTVRAYAGSALSANNATGVKAKTK